VTLQFRRSARRLRTHLGFWLYLDLAAVGFVAFWFALTAQTAQPVVWNSGGEGVAMLFGLFATVQALWLGQAALRAADAAIVGETTRQTEEVLLSTPLRSIALLGGRAGAIVLQLGVYVLALLPFYALMMLEGGLAPLQVLAAAVLTIVLVAWAASWSLLVAVIVRKRNAGAFIGFQNLLLGTGLLFLLQHLRAVLAFLRPEWGRLAVPAISEAAWSHLNLPKAYAEVVGGTGVTLSGDLPTVLLAHAGLAFAGCSALLVLAARLYRPRAAMGGLPLRTALWRMIRRPRHEARTPPRKSWERGAVRPWRFALAWRALHPAATPKARARWWTLSFLLTVSVLLLPPFLFALEYGVAYTVHALEEVADGRGLPPLPEGAFLRGGAMRHNPRSGRTERTAWGELGETDLDRLMMGGSRRSAHDGAEASALWLLGLLLLFVAAFPPLCGFLASGVVAREREADRLEPLLALPAGNATLAGGFVCEGSRGLLGILPGVVVALVTGLLATHPANFRPWLPEETAGLFLLYAASLAFFFTAWGLRVSLTSGSVRIAQTKLAGLYVGLAVGWPLLVGLVFALLEVSGLGWAIDSERVVWVLGLSPFFMLGIILGGVDGTAELWTGVLVGLAAFAVMGGVLWYRTIRTLRDLARRPL
jgi:hypothetical protein